MLKISDFKTMADKKKSFWINFICASFFFPQDLKNYDSWWLAAEDPHSLL